MCPKMLQFVLMTLLATARGFSMGPPPDCSLERPDHRSEAQDR